MILTFSTMLNGKPTYVPEKIIQGLYLNNMIDIYVGKELLKPKQIDKGHVVYQIKFKTDEYFKPKIHTIRVDEKDRWHEGMDIHFFINNRQPNMFMFAPITKVVSVQEIFMTYYQGRFEVSVDDRQLMSNEIVSLSENDGFENWENFELYFISQMKDGVFKGKIIHWTGKRY